MLNKAEVEQKMKERGFVACAYLGGTQIQFLSERAYQSDYEARTPPSQRVSVINVRVDLEKETFECTYILDNSITIMTTGDCGSVMNDSHFDRIVGRFESEAKWMGKLSIRLAD